MPTTYDSQFHINNIVEQYGNKLDADMVKAYCDNNPIGYQTRRLCHGIKIQSPWRCMCAARLNAGVRRKCHFAELWWSLDDTDRRFIWKWHRLWLLKPCSAAKLLGPFVMAVRWTFPPSVSWPGATCVPKNADRMFNPSKNHQTASVTWTDLLCLQHSRLLTYFHNQ